LARNFYVNLDRAEIGRFLKGSEVTSFLREVGEDVAARAGSDYSVEIDTQSRKSRAVANVIDARPEARFIEMRTGNLARALGASKK
jgi:hypothetical protein